MRTTIMILEHVVVCKVVDFVLHKVWMWVKQILEFTVTMMFLCFAVSLMKDADPIYRGFGLLFLLTITGIVSAESFNLTTDQKKISA